MADRGSYFLMRRFPVRNAELMSHTSRQSLKLSVDIMYQRSETGLYGGPKSSKLNQ